MPRTESPVDLGFRSRDDADPRAGAQCRSVSRSRGDAREDTRASGRRPRGGSCSTACFRCAAGLESLGFRSGEVMLVLGDNRPRLYAGMLAAGALDGYAMPAFRTRRWMKSATSCKRRARASCWRRIRSRSTRCSTCATQGAKIEHIIYDDARGLNALSQSRPDLVGGGRRPRAPNGWRRSPHCAMR